MAVTDFSISDFLDRVWFAVGSERTEEAKRLWYVDMYVLVKDVMVNVFRDERVRANANLRAMTETTWTLPLIGTLGAVDLADDAAGRAPSSPNIMTDLIRTVYHLSDSGARVRARKLQSVEDLDRPQPRGHLWWFPHDSVIDTISPTGATRFTPSDLTGSLEVHATFIPTVANFPNREALQPFVVEHMLRMARAKRDDRLAAALEQMKGKQ